MPLVFISPRLQYNLRAVARRMYHQLWPGNHGFPGKVIGVAWRSIVNKLSVLGRVDIAKEQSKLSTKKRPVLVMFRSPV